MGSELLGPGVAFLGVLFIVFRGRLAEWASRLSARAGAEVDERDYVRRMTFGGVVLFVFGALVAFRVIEPF